MGQINWVEPSKKSIQHHTMMEWYQVWGGIGDITWGIQQSTYWWWLAMKKWGKDADEGSSGGICKKTIQQLSWHSGGMQKRIGIVLLVLFLVRSTRNQWNKAYQNVFHWPLLLFHNNSKPKEKKIISEQKYIVELIASNHGIHSIISSICK